MAPELLKQDHSADFRADIYSLAVTFYKLFTGKTPPQPYTAPGELNPGLPEGVNPVLARALEDNPEHRHVTVKEFADDLAAQFDENVKPTPVPITPDRQSLKAAEAARIEQLAATRRKEHEGIDWRLVLLCGAVAVVIAVATVVLMSGR